jgi:hypothetical protein
MRRARFKDASSEGGAEPAILSAGLVLIRNRRIRSVPAAQTLDHHRISLMRLAGVTGLFSTS